MSTDDVRSLYKTMIDAWNERDADAFAGVFDADGDLVGFDGTEVRGPDAIAAHLRQIFTTRKTQSYVTIVRGVQTLVPQAGILRAVAGLVPDGQTSIDPRLNTVHRVVVVDRAGTWRCALFQNTPAQFHGRPQEAEQLTAELRAAT